MDSASASKLGPATGFLRSRGGGFWCAAAVFIAVCISVPVLVVTSAVFVPTGDVWEHLAATVLPRYMVNSALLLVGVGVGTFIVGVGPAWLVTMYQFPGRALFEWALILPFALIETLNDFGTVQYFAVDTLTTGIFRTWIGLNEPVAAAQLAFVVTVVVLERWTRGGRKVHQTSTRHQKLPRFRLPILQAPGVSLLCFLPIFLVFCCPAVH